mmetsp:Transcript_41014/g.87356  ORF Transcript_41014/g.87356 Transcript_41014/m.87356 type:complete len:227 (-) Transcript_41014:183-863(-)
MVHSGGEALECGSQLHEQLPRVTARLGEASARFTVGPSLAALLQELLECLARDATHSEAHPPEARPSTLHLRCHKCGQDTLLRGRAATAITKECEELALGDGAQELGLRPAKDLLHCHLATVIALRGPHSPEAALSERILHPKAAAADVHHRAHAARGCLQAATGRPRGRCPAPSGRCRCRGRCRRLRSLDRGPPVHRRAASPSTRHGCRRRWRLHIGHASRGCHR